MAKNRMRTGYFDRSGKFHEVAFIRSEAVFSDEVQGPIPNYQEPAEFSCKVECSDEFMKELKDSMKKLDLMILDAYDKLANAFEHCTDNRDGCGDCPFAGEENCRQKMRESVLHIIKSQRDLVERAIEEKWQDDAEGSL